MSDVKPGAISPDDSLREPILTYPRSLDEEAEHAIVAAFSTEPIDLNPDKMDPLYEWVDVEAVNELLDSTRGETQISTTIWGYQVTITADTVEVHGPA
jgi:hypothetical protein